MKVKGITFDCAGTLVDVDYSAARLALDAARDCGLQLDEADAETRYERLLETRWVPYKLLNSTGTESECDAFWRELTIDWLKQLGVDRNIVDAMIEAAHNRLYGPNSSTFRLFDDTIECLETAARLGYRMAVLSNWDYSLPRVLKSLGIAGYFSLVIASLVFGHEKPDPRIFAAAAQRLGLDPGEIVHVGDCPNDDFRGARAAGFHAVLIDRILTKPGEGPINSLGRLFESIRGIECS